MKKIAIFASGNGTNAQRIIEYFMYHPEITVSMVLCNNPGAFVLERARKLSVESIVFSRNGLYETDDVLKKLQEGGIDFIVLAGFLWLVPGNLIRAFKGRIINIHPALLPKYGGKGMYGMKVHETVIASGDRESGITIHFVNEKYDEGQVIFRAECRVDSRETPESLAAKIHELEHAHFPRVIEAVIMGGKIISN